MQPNKSSHWATQQHPVIKAALEATGARSESHKTVLGYVFSLRKFESASDFGCGLGLWLNTARSLGASRIMGYDIPEISREERKLGPDEFTPSDLSKPIRIERPYDLAISVEVAEHLPYASAATFVETLTNAADWVLFAAAIPYQGGMGHVNENWMEFWGLLFGARRYKCYDIIRPRFWHDASISYYYRQNTVLFVKDGADGVLKAAGFQPTANPPTLIHPEMYINAINRGRPIAEKRFEKDTKIFYRYAQMGAALPGPTQDITYGQEKLAVTDR